VNPLTCQAAVRAASDQLAGQLSDAERGALEEHLGGCDSCSCLMDQLYSTVAILGSHPGVEIPDLLRAMVAHMEGGRAGGRAEALTAQLPHLYALANALDADAADDLVQETLTSALADPDADTTGAGLAGALTRLAADRGPEVQSPAVPIPGSDPDADEPELFYPGLYADAPDAGAWVDQPVAWGEARVLGPEDDLVTTETYAAVDAALADLDPIDAGLVTLVDIEGAPLNRAALELDLSSNQGSGGV
jgi:DNA-directed RNA polymerase specialized sigma24 family protein